MKTQSPTRAEDFLLEVDRVFVYTTAKGEVISALEEIGFNCPNCLVRNAKRGTISHIVFFENAYLELLWIEDEKTVEQCEAQRDIRIVARSHWQQTGASPFGLGLRCKADLPELENLNPFIHFAAENLSSTGEPVCFVVPDFITLTSWLDCTSKKHQQLVSHPLGVKNLTNVEITINNYKELTETLKMLARNGVVTIVRGMYPLLELTFDNGVKGRVLDVRPVLPILFKY